MSGFDLYRYDKRLKRTVELMKADRKMIPENTKNIIAFSKARLARGTSYGRVAKVVYCLKRLSKMLNKPFGQADKENIISLMGELEATKYAEHTKYDFKVVLKMFYRWLLGNDEDFPSLIKWLKPKIRNKKSKLPEELITEEEVLKLVNAADNLRDKAMVLILYESGCRIGELLGLKMKNISFDKYGAVLRVEGKTGSRRVRIISSVSALSTWINNYANSENPEAPLWPPIATNHHYRETPIEHASFYRVLDNLAKKAGVRKKVYPHLFRHSRATALATKLTEAQMKEHFGWVQESEMAATYVHLSGRDVDDALLKLHGMKTDENKQEDKIKVRECLRCKENNSPIAKFCIRCGTPMDEKFISRVEEERSNSDNLMNRLMENAEFKDFMLKKIFEMGLEKKL